jgi:hypothetical protein
MTTRIPSGKKKQSKGISFLPKFSEEIARPDTSSDAKIISGDTTLDLLFPSKLILVMMW